FSRRNAKSRCSAIFRNAAPGVSRSATISLHTGTNVPRRASSLNSSNDVILIACELRQFFRRRVAHPTLRRLGIAPPLKLLFCLRDQHLEPAERLAARGRR